MKTVSASAKGQFTLPAAILRAMGIKGPTEFVVIQEGDRIILRKASSVGKREVDDLAGFENLASPVFQELWDNPEDEVWNDV